MGRDCDYPLLRDRFWSTSDDPDPGSTSSSAPSSPVKASVLSSRPGLRALDLGSLPRMDAAPTEVRARKDKLAYFERQCSLVAPGLCLGAEAVARDREALRRAGITHVLNCVGYLYPAFFADELEYLTLFLQDTPAEDIACVLYDAFDFIERARAGGGTVLVHCSQGVSRSVTLAIAYRMWKEGAAYDDVFAQVKAARGIANPNIGFVCQLLQWQKKRGQGAAKGRLVRMAPQSAAAPQYLVPRSVRGGSPACLDPRGSFVLHTESGVDVWLGGACPPPFAEAALRYAGQLSKYEGAPATPRIQEQGAENEAFWTALGDAGAGAARDTRIQRVAAYDQDFELFARLDLGPAATSDSDASPRSARKTPREDAGGDGPSPNERLRKLARGTVPGSRHQQPAAQARAGGEPGTAQQGPGQDVPPAGAGGPLRERQQNDGDSLAAKSPAHRARAVKEGEPRRVAAASPRRAAEAQ